LNSGKELRFRLYEIRKELQKDASTDPYIPKKTIQDDMLGAAFGKIFRIYDGGTQMSVFIAEDVKNLFGIHVSISFVQEGFLSVDDKLKLEKKNIFVQTEFKKQFCCFKCGQRFGTSLQLLCHMRDKKYFPFFQFPTRAVEVNGKKVHKRKRKIFICKRCKRQFLTKRSLWHHIHFMHTEKGGIRSRRKVRKYRRYRPIPGTEIIKWQCPWCTRGFISEEPFRNHFRNFAHFVCDICTEKFHKKSQLYQHRKEKHNEEYKTQLKEYKSMEAHLMGGWISG